ncbi:MAG: hypothetical protein ACE5G0_09630 [Rhodothermales bacterium]
MNIPSLNKRRPLYAAAALLCWILWAGIGTTDAWAQDNPFAAEPGQELTGEGWEGFMDYRFLGLSVLSLLLATVLGAVIAYHPKSQRTVESIEEVEAPKIYIMYAVVGAVIGIMVLKYGLVIGFVVFGIGGLVRFRSNLRSATKTGRVIFVTLIGLSSGLDLPHVAILATAFGFVLIYVLDARITYRIVVKGLPRARVGDAAEIYRSVLEQQGGRILSEKKNFTKLEVAFIFRAPHRVGRDDLEHLLEIEIPEEMQGSIDWETG